MEGETLGATSRKTLSVDEHTYKMLNQICARQRRTKINQLQVLIEEEWHRLGLDLEEDQ